MLIEINLIILYFPYFLSLSIVFKFIILSALLIIFPIYFHNAPSSFFFKLFKIFFHIFMSFGFSITNLFPFALICSNVLVKLACNRQIATPRVDSFCRQHAYSQTFNRSEYRMTMYRQSWDKCWPRVDNHVPDSRIKKSLSRKVSYVT